MERRSMTRPGYTEWHLTVRASDSLPPHAAAKDLFKRLAEAVVELEIRPIQQKVYGPTVRRAEILDIRERVFEKAGLDPSAPCTFIEGREGECTRLGGAQLWGIVPSRKSAVTVASVEAQAGHSGRLVSGKGFRMLYLPSIVGADSDHVLPVGVTCQAEAMFTNAEAVLQRHGFEYTDVVRTWIYLRRILDWYGELNHVRSAFHAERGITGGPDGRPFPASTGIQGTSAGEECVMDVLAIQADPGSGVNVLPLHRSSRQDPAFDYGSAFSRGMSVEVDGRQTILVSGTASIAADGRTLHLDDREPQVVETLLSIGALIERQGGSLQDICCGTFFYKDLAVLKAYQQVTKILGMPELPLVPVLADVCRPDLLVEIEAVAQVSSPQVIETSSDTRPATRAAQRGGTRTLPR